MAQSPKTVFACTNCGAQSPQVARALSRLRRVEHLCRGGGGAAAVGWGTRAPSLGGPGSKARLYADVDIAAGRAASPPASASSIACSAVGWSLASLVLLGGEPGIGKSTLLLQAAAEFAQRTGPVLY